MKMKPEVYSCLKMLESFNKTARDIFNATGSLREGPAKGLFRQYENIRQILERHLDSRQFGFIPVVSNASPYGEKNSKELILELISASALAVSYLKSLESDLDKELERREKELALKEKEIESYKNILKGGVEALKEMPELLRSTAVANMKKKHREIEKYSRTKLKDSR